MNGQRSHFLSKRHLSQGALSRNPTTAKYRSWQIALLTVALSVSSSKLVFADTHNAPEGWKAHEQYAPLGIEAYQSNNGALAAIVERKPAPAGDREAWFMDFIKGKLSKYTLQKLQGPFPLNDDAGKRVPGAYLAMATAKTQKGELVTATYGVLFRKQTQIWQIFWKNKNKDNASLIANALNFMSEGRRKGGAPAATNDTDRHLAERNSKKLPKPKAPKPGNTATTNEPQPFVAAPGKGVRANQLRGVIYDFGKMTRKKVWVNDSWMLIPKWQGSGVYMVFNDDWAYKRPSIAPVDLDVAASRRVEPNKWVRWKDVRLNAPTSMMPPLKRGTRIDISVQRANTTSSSRRSVRTSWSNLTLTSDGRFETGRTTISSRQQGIDSTMAPSSSTVTSSDKNGSFTGISGRYDAGGGSLTQGRRQTGSQGNHTGTYFIDGNTIELRYDDGSITRAVFGFDGEREIIFGGTNYWVPGNSK